MLKAIKVRLYPSVDQEIYLGKLFGCSRFVYNKCLDFKINEYKEAKKCKYIRTSMIEETKRESYHFI
jgi:putative transposase